MKRFLLIGGAFTLAMLLGWELPWLMFGMFFDIGPGLFLCAGIGIVGAAVFMRRERKGTQPRFWISAAWFFGVFFVLILGLHYAKRQTRFAFLGKQPLAFEAMATDPFFLYHVYTYPGDTKEVFARAKAELEPLGFEDRTTRGSSSFDLMKGDVADWSLTQVSIQKGRATGKFFQKDGDTLKIDKSVDWVTVEIFEPDLKLRIIAPP